jgi:hypothetical protein
MKEGEFRYLLSKLLPEGYLIKEIIAPTDLIITLENKSTKDMTYYISYPSLLEYTEEMAIDCIRALKELKY